MNAYLHLFIVLVLEGVGKNKISNKDVTEKCHERYLCRAKLFVSTKIDLFQLSTSRQRCLKNLYKNVNWKSFFYFYFVSLYRWRGVKEIYFGVLKFRIDIYNLYINLHVNL